MNLERVAAVIRPRSRWEALDLGFGLARGNAYPVWGAWLAVFLPVYALAWAVFREGSWAFLAVWWLKPLLDRVPLFVLSRALFGATPTVGQTLRQVPRLWWRGLFWGLTLQRLDPRRSFTMPVWELEGLTGRARRKRLEVLKQRQELPANALTAMCVLFEQLLTVAGVALFFLLAPDELLDTQAAFAELVEGPEAPLLFSILGAVTWGAAVAFLEPFYVAAGFALYINRRTHLEGWDIELAFRRLARRLSEDPSERASERMAAILAGGRKAALGLALGLALGGAALPARAQEAPPPARDLRVEADPQDAIGEVLADPVFGGEETVERWVPRWEEPPDEPDFDADSGIGGALAGPIQVLIWIVAGGCVVALVVYALRNAPLGGRRGGRRQALPEVVAGFDIRPESLPADVPGEAWRQWEAGEHAAALSLLYRGALARLVERYDLGLDASATEGDCLEAVRRVRGPVDFMAGLTAAWEQVAYADRIPTTEVVRVLCDAWPRACGRDA